MLTPKVMLGMKCSFMMFYYYFFLTCMLTLISQTFVYFQKQHSRWTYESHVHDVMLTNGDEMKDGKAGSNGEERKRESDSE